MSAMTKPELNEHRLEGGLILRQADDDDVEQIVELSCRVHGDYEESGVRHLMNDPRVGPTAWLVVVDGDRVVSTSALLPLPLRLHDNDVPGGQIEFVGTDDRYRRRGLVRAQFVAHHERSAREGHLLQLVDGIPYLYRHLGYGYGTSHPDLFELVPGRLPGSGTVTVRRAAHDDLPDLQRLHDRAQRRCDLVRIRSGHDWALLVADEPGSNGQLLVAVEADRVVGSAGIAEYPRVGWLLDEGAADTTAAAGALLGAGRELAGESWLAVFDRPGDLFGTSLRAAGSPTRGFNALCTRIADPLAFLEWLRPVLDHRLNESALAGERGSLWISTYVDGFALGYADGEITSITRREPSEDPIEDGAIGVSPDWLPALLLGRFDPIELERGVDDVTFNRYLPIVEALFPEVSRDLMGVL